MRVVGKENDGLPLPELPTQRWMQSIDQGVLQRVTGRVSAVVGENIEVEGMTAPVGAVCRLTNQDARLIVVGFRGQRMVMATLQRPHQVSAGDQVELVDRSLRVKCGPELVGHVIDAFGNPIDESTIGAGLESIETERPAPDSFQRPPITERLHTGVRAIDAMLTCGKGQRMGIFAGSGVGKSTLLGMLAKGTTADRIVVALVGERGREVPEFVQRTLGPEGMKRSVLVVATADSPAAQRVAAASTATAIAESFRDQGQDVLLLFDSITRLAMAHREISLAGGEAPSTNGYPPSVFNHVSRLVERAGRTEQGSITAFYSVLVEGDRMDDPVADALRGMLDGHVVLSRELASRAHWPPIDVLGSISRCQSHLISQPEYSQQVAAVRRGLADYEANRELISLGAYHKGNDAAVDHAIEMHPRISAFLQQSQDESISQADVDADLAALCNASAEMRSQQERVAA